MPGPDFDKLSKAHLRRLGRIIDKGGVRRLRRVYMEAQRDLERKLVKLIGSSKSEFTVHKYKMMLAQIKAGNIEMSRKLAAGLGKAATEAQIEALETLIRDVAKLEKQFTGSAITVPVEEASRFAGVMDRNATSLLKKHQQLSAKYSTNIIRKMEMQLAQSLVQAETAGEAMDRIMAVSDMEWWQAERIVRTEQAWAYNYTHREGIEETAKEIPDMQMRWVEYISDATGQPLDDRVGKDSIAMHGQVVAPGGLFRMPPGAPGVSLSLQGKAWTHPPNRPNDRAVLQPWRPHWGVPGWWLRGNQKIPL